MKMNELNELDDQALREKLNDLWRSLFELRIQKATEQKAPLHQFKKNRRTIARIKTLLRHREMGMVSE